MKEITERNPALIAGAGIAGPMLAVALHRAGIPSIVYEGAETPRDRAGAFLNLAPNGLTVLRALGLESAADRIGFRNDVLIFHNERGQVLAETSVGGATVMRGELSRAIRETAEAMGIRFEFGKRLASVEGTAGVTARFADGSCATGSLLIGADGIHSRARVNVAANAPKPAYTGILNLGGITKTDLPPTGRATHMIFGKRAFFGYAVRPSGETYWFSNYAQAQEPEPGSLPALDGDEVRRRLLEEHREDPAEVIRILENVSGDVGTFPIYEVPPLPQWHAGRVCLIGDAAHAIGPHAGQGASLALEDAFDLARCLRDASDGPSAFVAFERLRRGRVDRVVNQTRRIGKQKAPSGWMGRTIRDLVLPLFLRLSAKKAQELYTYTADWDAPAVS